MRTSSAVACAVLLGLTAQPASAITITLDYSLDTGGFFTSDRKSLLAKAADFFEIRLTDDLDAIISSGSNSFDAKFTHPSSGAAHTITDYSVAADTLVVFAGARDLGGSTLGVGGPGGFSASGTSGFLDTVKFRGETGATSDASTSTDFGPWGGALAFDSDSSWYIDDDPSTLESFSGMNDFFSVALHELGHVLGYGTAKSWDHWISGTDFTGPASTAEHGGSVPLDGGLAHWLNGTSSVVDSVAQETAMDPSITVGTRKVFTDLDMAGLTDIGWDVTPIPLPPALWLMSGGLLGLLSVGRRRNQ